LPKGIAQLQSRHRGAGPPWAKSINNFTTTLLPQRTTAESDFFLFDQFQIALPPDGNTIILQRKAGVDPVDVSYYPKVSCRRKRHHAPAGE
jgi:hypothetical protein